MGRTAYTEPQCLYKGALYCKVKIVRSSPVSLVTTMWTGRLRNRSSILGRDRILPVYFVENCRVLCAVVVLDPCQGLKQQAVKLFTHLLSSVHINPLKPELNPICYLLALLGAHHFLHVGRIRVKLLTFRLLMSYIYGAPILDVSRSHTTTQHSR